MPPPPEDPRRTPRRIDPRGLLTGVPETPPLRPSSVGGLLPPQPPAPLSFLAPYFEGAFDVLKGATVGSSDEDSPWAKGGELTAAGLPLVGGAKGLLGAGRGLYSRIDDLLARLPAKGVHPNKLAAMLKSGASQEEVAYRKIPELLAGHGEKPITPEELRAHLQAHPAPFPETTTLGETGAKGNYTVVQHGADVSIVHPNGSVKWSNDGKPLAPDQLQDLIAEWHNKPARPEVAAPTKFGPHTLPGGESYREKLFTLPRRPVDEARRTAIGEELEGIFRSPEFKNPAYPHSDVLDRRIAALNKERDALEFAGQFTSGHFDEPNVVAHTRYNERTLPPAPMRSLDEIEPIIQDVVGAKRPEHIASGGPSAAVRQGLITPDEAALYANSRGFYGYAPPTGPRGRFVEEIQSDWHQQGKTKGYQQPATPAQQQRLAQLHGEIEAGQRAVADVNHELKQVSNTYQDQIRAETRAHLPPEFQHLISFSDALQGNPGAVVAWRTARDARMQSSPALRTLRETEYATNARLQAAVNRVTALQEEQTALHTATTAGVPDAPFKESWPDLALKQHLLDVAEDPKLDWLGVTGGKTQAERYDLSKQVDYIDYRRAGDQFELGAVSTAGDPVSFPKTSYSAAELPDVVGKEIAEKIVSGQGQPGGGRMTLRGVDLQVGGEGMAHFYDQLIPARLRKLVKPFGGAVEPFGVPTSKPVMQETRGFTVIDRNGHSRGIFATEAEAQAYIANPPDQMRHLVHPDSAYVRPANTVKTVDVPHQEPGWMTRLTPEMKQRILKEGFPLLMLPLAVQQALAGADARPGEQVGEPPPVTPPTRPTH